MTHKLLLADDSITIQRVIELTFADEDVQVLAVGDGKKAIASIQSDRPDIVLADVGMPERDGYEVAEFIKGNPQLASIPVLLLTGAFEPIDETRARAVGCDGVLVKPFEPQMVINRVKDLLAGRRSGGLWGAKTVPSPPSREAPPAPPGKDVTTPPESATGGSAPSTSLEDYFDRLDAAFASVEAATEVHSPATIAPQPAAETPAPEVATGASAGLARQDLEGWDPDLAGDPERPSPVAPRPVTPPPAPPAAAQSPNPPIRFKPAAPASPVAAVPAPEAAVPSASPAPAASMPPVPAPVAVPLETQPANAQDARTPAVELREAATPQPPAPALIAVTPPVPVLVAAPPAVVPPAVTTPAAPPDSSQAPIPSLADAFAALFSAEQGRSISPSKVGASSIPDQAIDEIVSRVIARMADQAVRETVIGVAERLVREEIERIRQGQ